MLRTSLFSTLLFAVPAVAQDWTNLGGNSAANGLTSVVGPALDEIGWEVNETSLISWSPFVSEGRVFTVRQTGFPQNGGPANDFVLALDLDTGSELWRTTLPFGGDTDLQWIAWIAGAKDGRLYVSRSSNGTPQPITALDAATGNFLWDSGATTEAFAYEGLAFAPDGDLLVGDFSTITRIEGTDGSTVWSVPRLCPVSGNCGVAANSTALYYDSPVVGGNVVVKLDIATGVELAQSPVMPGFTAQNSPFLSPSGDVVYFSRSQNNASVDALFAFQDAGASLDLLWDRPIRWTTSHRHGSAPDGSIYTFLPSDEFVRLDGATGDVLNTAGVLTPIGSNLSPYTVVDGAGRVYLSNGWAGTPINNGKLWAWSGDLERLLFDLQLARPNQGGPVLAQTAPGEPGTLVVCDLQAVRAYRSSAIGPIGTPYCDSTPNSSGLPARMSATDSVWITDEDFVLRASGVPDQFGIFYFGPAPVALPFGNGTRCVGGQTFRFPPVSAVAGELVYPVDFTTFAGMALAPGSTYFQAWFRDPAGGGALYDLSDGLRIELQ